MEYIQKLRIKTAMIVYELEKSLGNYIIDNEQIHSITDSSIESIINREKNEVMKFKEKTLILSLKQVT